MSKLAILGCQNYYRFDSMLAKHVKRHQYFVTQLFMVHFIWGGWGARILIFETIFWLFLIHPFLTTFH